MVKLGVNIDHVATLRQARGGNEPEPVFAALACQTAGSDSIVAHLREDRRHIQERDLFLLKQAIGIRLNLEMSVAEDILEVACKLKPYQATLVPEKRKELTTEGGLDVLANMRSVARAVTRLKKNGIAVSIFIDPQKRQIDASKKSGADMVELHTGRYAQAKNNREQDKYFAQIRSSAAYAVYKGLIVNAGHGLDYRNTARIARIKVIEELNIGFSIISRAVFVGLSEAVREMKGLIAG
ncbi:MAG: pyridoxine 5'-phosphate synthase [Candidatus Omnitrophota bacterium]